MNRRRFLKLVAGAVALTQVPSILATLGPGDMKLAFNNPTLDYRLVVFDLRGRTLWAPKTKRVIKITNESGTVHLETCFIAEDIQVDRTPLSLEGSASRTLSIVPVGSRVLDPEGRTVCERQFSGPVFCLNPYDTLRLTHSINL